MYTGYRWYVGYLTTMNLSNLITCYIYTSGGYVKTALKKGQS